MHILILGAKGQLGTALHRALGEQHTLSEYDLPELDITDRAAVNALITPGRFAVVINTAAYTDVEGCARQPTLAYQVNGLGAQNVALACDSAEIPLVHISTNELFPGDKPAGYDEWDTPCPINPYGLSKAAGEFHVRHLARRHYIVRTAWLFAPGGRNFIHAILQRARSAGQVRVVTNEVSNPTYVDDLAAALGRLIQTQQYGTYHLTNAGSCSRWDFAQEILRQAGLSHIPNAPILSQEFTRLSSPPPYCALRNNAAAALGITLRPWQAALTDYLAGQAET